MSSFQRRELLAKSEVFEKQHATTLEESENRIRLKYKRAYHVRVLSRIACEWQCRILLKSRPDRILATERLGVKSVAALTTGCSLGTRELNSTTRALRLGENECQTAQFVAVEGCQAI